MTAKRKNGSSGGRSKRIGKDGERNAGKFLTKLGCHTAMTEISGLAGDDKFIKDPNGKWWSVEVKNCVSSLPAWVKQARTQAEERFTAIQSEMGGEHGDIYYALGLHTFRKSDWFIMWHPRNYGLAANDWLIWFNRNGRVGMTVMNEETGWVL